MSPRTIRLPLILFLLVALPVAAEEQPEPDLPDPPTTLKGRVVDQDGKPVPGAEVRLCPPFIPMKKCTPIVLTTDEAGEFEATDLEEEVGQIAADAPGFDGYHDSKFTPDGEPVVITLDPGVLVVGRVFDRATTTPVVGATVRVCEHWMRYFADEPCTELTTDADGRFRTNDAGGHIAVVDAWSPRHARTEWTRPIPKITGGVATISGADLYLGPGGRVSGQVLDPGEEPVENAIVKLRPADPKSREARQLEPQQLRTDSAGRYVLDGVPADLSFILLAEADGFAKVVSDPLSIKAGEDLKDFMLRLPVGATLRVRLADPDGKPVPSLEFSTWNVKEDEASRRNHRVSWTKIEAQDDEGVFTLAHLEPGEFDITLRPESQQEIRLKSVELADGEITDLGTLETTPGLAIGGRVTDESGEPVEEATITVSWRDGDTRSQKETTTNTKGEYRVTGLPETTVSVGAGSARFVRGQSAEGTPGGDDVNIALLHLPRISGRVVLPNGDAPPTFEARANLEGVRVRDPLERQVGHETFEDPEGKFVLHVWQEGDVTLEILAPGMQTRRVEVPGLTNGKVHEVGKIILEPGLTVRGQVIDGESGAPVAGAMVFLTAMQGSPFLRLDPRNLGPNEVTQSGPDGAFELGGQEPGNREVVVEHPDFVQSRTGIRIEPASDLADVIIRLGQGGTIEGTVLDANDEPMAGVLVFAMSMAGPTASSRSHSDERGHYRLEGLPSGGVTVGSRGFRPQQATVVDGETTVVDVRESAGISVSGRVLRGQEPVGDVFVVFQGVGGRAKTQTDASGNYEVEVEGAGRYRVAVVRSLESKSPETTLSWVIPDEPQVKRDIVLHAGRIEGRVTDPEGSPLRGVSVHAAASGTGEIIPTRFGSVRTDDDGRYEIAGLAAGSYVVRFTSESYPTAERSTEIRDEVEATRVDVELSAGAPLVGRVIDPAGTPVADAKVVAAASGTDRVTRAVQASKTGRFEIDVPEGQVDVAAAGGGWAPGAVTGVVVDELGADGEVVVRLGVGGTARVVATRQDGSPAAGAIVLVAPERELLKQVAFQRFPQPTDAAGVSLQPRLAPGRHEVYLVTMDGNVEKLPVTVEIKEGEEATVEVVLP